MSESKPDPAPDLTLCDREPIHIPGSIQPHGLLLVFERGSLVAVQAAGDVETRLGIPDWLGRSAGSLLTDALADRIARAADSSGPIGYVGRLESRSGEVFDVGAQQAGDRVCVELEPVPEAEPGASTILGALEMASAGFEHATGLRALCKRAASEFRRLIGYDRVLVYQFLENGSGVVLAEDRDPGLPTFLNHHFPSSDIPAQARALYVRKLVRVIPDIGGAPAPLRPPDEGHAPLDMSDLMLRAVSPIHIQYMKNMGVGASASVSIVKDGVLWGLVACHNVAPKSVPYDVRAACRALAGGFARQIKAKEEAGAYRERIRLRGFEDELAAALCREEDPDHALTSRVADLRRMLDADGMAILAAGHLATDGACPGEREIKALGRWVASRPGGETYATEELSADWPEAASYRAAGSGLLAVAVSPEEPLVLLWFRVEQVETVNWAGNPHKAVTLKPGEVLSPRASFEAWSEIVRGRARPWSAAETEAASRLRHALLEARQRRHLRDLNRRLSQTLADKDLLLGRQDVLLKEVNHRVQNSLTLVASFLGLQARATEEAGVKAQLDEAQRRIGAVALVHRRLYRADQVETIDLARYLDDLCREMLDSMGPEWAQEITLDTAPVSVQTDRAVPLGLILTELVINANKYAYGGAPGPIDIALEQDRTNFRLSVADRGHGRHLAGQGFGTRMVNALVAQLSGSLEYRDNRPGLQAVLTAPLLIRSAA